MLELKTIYFILFSIYFSILDLELRISVILYDIITSHSHMIMYHKII